MAACAHFWFSKFLPNYPSEYVCEVVGRGVTYIHVSVYTVGPLYSQVPHPWIQPIADGKYYMVCGWFNLQMQNLWIWRANSKGLEDLWILVSSEDWLQDLTQKPKSADAQVL